MGTRRLAAWIVTTLLVLAAAGRPVRAEPVLALGSLERESVDEALEELGLTLDPTPEGKRIGRIHVVTHDVFSRRDGKFQFLNHFHRTTRARAIERELLLRPGELWDDSLADESVRNLQAMAPLFFSDGTLFGAPEITGIVVIVPIQSAIPGGVDLLVVTRDVWSLRTNTEFAFQKDTLSMLRLSLSENNLMGWRKQLAASFDMDLGRYGVGPTYFDPNVLGTRLTLLARGTVWYARDTGRREGDSEVFSLRLPLYALARTWGAALDVSHQDAVVRSFCDHILCPVDVGGTSVPLTYRLRTLSADGNVVRSFGKSIVQRLTAGYRVFRTRALVDDDFPADPAVADAFLDEWAPVRETRSEPYLRYE
ncbi:MAG TPA: hypothetical protein VHU40_05655, partial [Polyangia bacterium]|nr:hypothetical protein [Polyangia bacterium]